MLPAVAFQEAVRARVREALKRANVTQRDLAKALAITQGTMSKKLSGQSPLTLEDIEQIARIIKADPQTQLLGSQTQVTVPTDSTKVQPSNSSATKPKTSEGVVYESPLIHKIATRVASLDPAWQERALDAVNELIRAEESERRGKVDPAKEGSG
jgi:transcriptional regulator with XRE-family HTH domain